MRVGVITCNNADNYGARLQAYALQSCIASLGYDAKVIDYKPAYMTFGTKLWYFPGFDVKGWAKLVLQYRQRQRMISKHAAMEGFSRSFLRLTRCYHDVGELRDNPPEADVYIAGSDQIWNPTFANGSDHAYYLDFGTDAVRRISYAASIAVPQIDDPAREFMRQRLARLDAVSVREESAAAIVGGMGYPVDVVCDPVFLLSPQAWTRPDLDDEGAGEDYLLVYDFENTPEMVRAVKRLARNRGLKIYSVSPQPASYADRNYCDCSPWRFVALVRNARVVVSNSLHGSIFSMVFGREFYVVNRIDGLNSRMAELLVRYGLSERIVTADNIVERSAPLPDIYTELEADIERSRRWLADQLLAADRNTSEPVKL